MSETILALDLCRYKSVACIYRRSTREHTFRTLDTALEDLTGLLARHLGAVVVVEACAPAGVSERTAFRRPAEPEFARRVTELRAAIAGEGETAASVTRARPSDQGEPFPATP